MKTELKLWAFPLLLLLLGVAKPANATVLTIDSTNLEDYALKVRETPVCGDDWTTTVKVSGKQYVRRGCAGSQTYDTMMDDLDEVLKSPYSETCIIQEACWGNQCRRTYGTHRVNRVIKAIVNDNNQITSFVRSGTISPCE